MFRPFLLLIVLASPVSANDLAKRSEWELTRIEYGLDEHQEKIIDESETYTTAKPVWETKSFPLLGLLLIGFVIAGMRRLKSRRRAMLYDPR